MKTKYSIIIAFFILATDISCKKNSTQTQSNPLQGNWGFISEQAHTQNTTQYTSGGGVVYKTITVSDYTTINDSGVVNITANMMNVYGLTYTISGNAVSSDYQDGQLINSSSAPFAQYVPPTNSSSSYVLVGNDSVSFPSGGFANPSGQSTGANGARINISGDTLLTMVSYFNKDSTIFLYGMSATTNYQATLTTKLRRQ